MDVHIPSPTVFLQKSPVIEPAPAPIVKKPVKPRSTTTPAKKVAVIQKTDHNSGVSKPKQSKSRNGCLTCKKKRLKCDETKPGCQNCQKRSVPCEGYRKDYKWRTFEETTFATKPAGKPKKVLPIQQHAPNPTHQVKRDVLHETSPTGKSERSTLSSDPSPPDGSLPFYNPGLSFDTPRAMDQNRLSFSQPHTLPHLSPNSMFIPSFDSPSNLMPFMESFDDPFQQHANENQSSGQSSLDDPSSHDTISTFSSGSPSLRDLCLPGTDLRQPPDPSEPRPPPSPDPYRVGNFDAQMDSDMMFDEEFDEEVVRHGMSNMANGGNSWSLRLPSPVPSESSSSSDSSDWTIYAPPNLKSSSPEMLALRFDQQTCGILSVKDGPTENPWRTFVWPMAQNSPALYHALSSMTAFHASNESREMRVSGVQHMHTSIKSLSAELSNMQLDAALATALALAFSESWDEHISTGIQHLKGAKVLMNQAVVKHRNSNHKGQVNVQNAAKMKFLCNTFIYMDVIARLTSLEEDNDFNFEEVLATVNAPSGEVQEVDPLLGCASTLFPLIGRVANLIQRVRKTDANSIPIISEAMELKQLLEQWQVPDKKTFERPEDPDSHVEHSFQTAEAYRFAILLYLHQAVPEIPSETTQALARQILIHIACVPISSRATIIQIFPLLAASCEVVEKDDREWADGRWRAMIQRLKIGNVEKCLVVVQEVWRRRDVYEAQRAERLHRRQASRGAPTASFIPPVLGSMKKKARTADVLDEGSFFGMNGEMTDHVSMATHGRPSKRRFTMDAMGQPMSLPTATISANPTPLPSPVLQRRSSDMMLESMEPEFTVRGRLHWIGVMRDWNWEILLG